MKIPGGEQFISRSSEIRIQSAPDSPNDDHAAPKGFKGVVKSDAEYARSTRESSQFNLLTSSVSSRVLVDGEFCFFDGNEFRMGTDGDYYGCPYTKGGCITVGKNSTEALEAHSSPCRIVVFYNHETKLGAIIHIGVESIGTSKKAFKLIDKLIEEFPIFLAPDTTVAICGDVIDELGCDNSNGIKYDDWNNAIRDYILGKDVQNIAIFSRGRDKDVYLNTGSGRLVINDINSTPIYDDSILNCTTSG